MLIIFRKATNETHLPCADRGGDDEEVATLFQAQLPLQLGCRQGVIARNHVGFAVGDGGGDCPFVQLYLAQHAERASCPFVKIVAGI